MTFKNKVYEITKQNVATLKEIRKSLDDLKTHENDYSKEKYNQLLSEIDSKRLDVISSGKKDIQAAFENYKKSMNQKFKLDGGAITDDVKLLDGSFSLDGNQLEGLLEKYCTNMTMQTAIWNYAEKNNIAINGTPRTEHRAVDCAETLFPFYDSVMARPEWDDIWLNHDYYDKITVGIEDDPDNE